MQRIGVQMTWGNQNTEKEAHEQLCYAFDNGINIFDSAESVRFRDPSIFIGVFHTKDHWL